MPLFSSRWKLIYIIGFILSFGFIVVNLANYYVSSNSVRSALINNELPLTSNNIYSEIQASLLRPIYISSLMANDTFLKDWILDGEKDELKVRRYLQEIQKKYTVSSTFLVSAQTNHYYHFSGILKDVSPKVPKDQWFFSMEKHDGNYRVDVDTNEAKSNLLTIFVNHKVHDYEGNFLGVTGLGLEVVSVASMIDRYKDNYQRNIYFVDREGQIKSHPDESLIDKVNIQKQPGIARVAAELLAGKEGFLIYEAQGGNMLLSYRYLPELDWFLLVEQREKDALEPIRHALYFNLAISAVVTVVVLLISGFTIHRFQARLETLARTDKLTGLYNRQYFEALFSHELKGIGRQSSSMSLAIFDLDYLKQINDGRGHLAGDQLLQSIAILVRGLIRKNDVLARWGGDEFVILFSDCGLDTAARLMEKIRERVVTSLSDESYEVPVSISAGVAEYRAGDSYHSLLARADNNLYQAKKHGRNCVDYGAKRD